MLLQLVKKSSLWLVVNNLLPAATAVCVLTVCVCVSSWQNVVLETHFVTKLTVILSILSGVMSGFVGVTSSQPREMQSGNSPGVRLS